MTPDRSYTTSEEMIFQMCGVESWTELWERLPEIEFMQALMAEGLISETALRKRMIQERVSGARVMREEIRRLASELGMSESSITANVYR